MISGGVGDRRTRDRRLGERRAISVIRSAMDGVGWFVSGLRSERGSLG